jgi:flagellin
MSLSVLNNIAAIYAQNNLNQTQSSLQNVLTQLSSGSRINSGADDAAGLAIVDGLQANSTALTQSAQNASDGVGLLQTADGALSQVTSLLNRAVTLATESANGTLNASQVSSANQEYQNILTEIDNIGSTTNFNGNSVFSNTATTFFVSDGTSSGANIYTDQVGVLSTGSVGLTAATGTPATSALTASAGTTAGAASASSFTITPSGGASTTYTGTITLSAGGGSSHTLTESSATSGSQLASDITSDATFQAEGISASYNNTSGVVTVTGPTGANKTLTVGGTLTPNSGTVAESTPSASSAAAHGTSTLTLGASTNTVAGTITLAVGSGATHSITLNASSTGQSVAQQISSDSTFAAEGISAAYNSNTGAVTITGPSGSSSALSTTGTSLTQTTVPGFGSGVDFTNASISSLTASSAQTVLTSVTQAIQDVAYQRGIIGADSNQLTSASAVASSESENLTAAQSSIDSTDYGQATSALAKYQVLSQTGISALAQANSVQQEILKLLQ